VLNGLDGRKSGTVEGYSYSDGNKNSGITWNAAQFKDYIKDPKAKIPGTKMSFAGIKNEKEINDLWAFISQYDKDGKTKQWPCTARLTNPNSSGNAWPRSAFDRIGNPRRTSRRV